MLRYGGNAPMGKSSLEYSEKLYSQIQEEYGKLVYTYTCHFKMADRLSKRNFWIKWGQIGLSAISTGGFLEYSFQINRSCYALVDYVQQHFLP